MKNYIAIASFILFIEVVTYGECSEHEVTMSCERTCLSQCKTKLNSVFTINDNHDEVKIPDEDCYDEYLRREMDEEDLEVCKDSELDPVKGSKQMCHVQLLSDGKQGKNSANFQPNAKAKKVNCHLPNYNDDEKYYKDVPGEINVEPEQCVEECYTRCNLCWAPDNCIPVCQQDEDHAIEGFAPVECSKPFYFCNAGLSTNTLEVVENGKTRKLTKPFHVGTCSLDPALPVFFSILILLLLMLLLFKCRNPIRACLGH